MDFVAPTLLEHYIGGTFYGGAGTQNDPVDLVSSDDEEAQEEEQAQELPTHVPVVELRDIKLRAGKDGSGYDRNLKMKNWSLDKSSGPYTFLNALPIDEKKPPPSKRSSVTKKAMSWMYPP